MKECTWFWNDQHRHSGSVSLRLSSNSIKKNYIIKWDRRCRIGCGPSSPLLTTICVWYCTWFWSIWSHKLTMRLGVEDAFLTGYYLPPVHVCSINGLSWHVILLIFNNVVESGGNIHIQSCSCGLDFQLAKLFGCLFLKWTNSSLGIVY